MKKYDKLIIKYIDDQLSKEERKSFEKELEIINDLNKDFHEFKKVKELFSNKNEKSLTLEYFNTIVPRFRQSLEQGDRSYPIRKIGYVFATIIIILSTYLVFQYYFFNPEIINNSSQLLTEDLSQEEIYDIADYISDDSQELLSAGERYQVLDDIDFSLEEITANVSAEERLLILNDYKINDIYSLVNSEELEYAYNELLSKRIF